MAACLIALACLAAAEASTPSAARNGADFWGQKLAGRGGLRPDTPATSKQVGVGAPTPEAALTDALSSGPTNRRPAQESAERERAAIKEVLQDMGRLEGSAGSAEHRRQLLRKRTWGGKGGWSTGAEIAPVAPRTWDTHLQSFNEQHGRDAEERRKADFVAKLGRLISHLNATIVSAPKKQVLQRAA